MPELPDIIVYCERLSEYIGGRTLEGVRIASPALVRTFDPSYRECVGKKVTTVHNMAKRIVLGFEDDLFLVIHLMISGRLRWKPRTTKVPKKRGLAGFTFEHGLLLFTEASSHKRASLHCVRGKDELVQFDRGGLEVPGSTLEAFSDAIKRENRTLKRGLTDPRILSGIGNSYSDEILHRARLSPLKRTRQLTDAELALLHQTSQDILLEWTDIHRKAVGDGFPDKVTAFHKKMAVHGKFREPCPVCSTPVQRIAYASNECNYCATCQTGGRLLSDRSLARLLHDDWPKTVEELEGLRGREDA